MRGGEPGHGSPPERIAGSHWFAQPVFRRYFWTQDYTAASYLDVLRTYSGHIALPEPNQSALYSCIRRLIDDRYGGRITKGYLAQLTIARRLP
jgi:hypothetical protein